MYRFTTHNAGNINYALLHTELELVLYSPFKQYLCDFCTTVTKQTAPPQTHTIDLDKDEF